MPPGCLFELCVCVSHGTSLGCDVPFPCTAVHQSSSSLCCPATYRALQLYPLYCVGKAAVVCSCACCLQVEIQDTIKPLPGQSEAKQMKKASRFSISATTMFCEALPC